VPASEPLPASEPDLAAIHALVAEDMRGVDRHIERRLASDVALINHVAQHIIHSGGKRLRPLVVLLSARACGYDGDTHLGLAAIIEFIHTATLLHDDVVDSSELRRGQESANALWGDKASVLVGDFLYSRSFQMMVDLDSMHIMNILADTTNVIAEGEVLQLLNCHDPDTREQQYLAVIRRKTAKLFEAASRLGAIVGGAPQELERAMAAYGLHLGTAYQLVDDVLDYRGTREEIGKNVGDDLAEGKPTLPLIRAMACGDAAQADIIRRAIQDGGRESIRVVVDAVEDTGAIEYTARAARDEANRALKSLRSVPDSPYRRALEGLADFAVARTY